MSLFFEWKIPAEMSYTLLVNGQNQTVADTVQTVTDLIALLGLTGQRIAVELDGALVPRSRHASTRLCAGMRVEIVHAVGGG